MNTTSKKMPNLLGISIILGAIDIFSKAFNQYNTLSELEIGLNWEKGFWISYLLIGIYVNVQLYNFKKWAYFAIFAIAIINLIANFYVEIREFDLPHVVARFLGFYFLFNFSIIMLLIKRKLYFE